jgi:hypothetical protein
MKYQERALRVVVALSIAGLDASQIPTRNQIVLGSVSPPTDGYLKGGDNFQPVV